MAAAKKSSGTKKAATTARKGISKAPSTSKTAVGGNGSIRKGKRGPGRPKTAAIPKPKTILNHRAIEALNVYVFGSGDSGVLGLGPRCSTDDVVRPRLNPNLSASSVGVVQVATGGMHCVALTSDNKILTWGVNDHGALGRDTEWSGGWVDMDGKGRGEDSDGSESELNPRESTPTAIDESCFPNETVFTQVAAGDNATFALTEEGLVYGWGTFKVSILYLRLPNVSLTIFSDKRRRFAFFGKHSSPKSTRSHPWPAEHHEDRCWEQPRTGSRPQRLRLFLGIR